MDFFNSLSSIISSIISVVQALWYWLTTLLSAVRELIVQLFEWYPFINTASAFGIISNYIGWTATVFFATILFVIIIRIWVSFVFRILKLNIDYHSSRANTEKYAAEDSKRNHNLFS